jgi:hypothetical protein
MHQPADRRQNPALIASTFTENYLGVESTWKPSGGAQRLAGRGTPGTDSPPAEEGRIAMRVAEVFTPFPAGKEGNRDHDHDHDHDHDKGRRHNHGHWDWDWRNHRRYWCWDD